MCKYVWCMCVHVCVWVCLSCGIPSVCDAVCLAVCMCMCACAQVCQTESVCERCCVRMRRCACRHGQARACMRTAACARVRCRVRDGVRARGHTADASPQSHLTASPVYESSEGREESAYDDRMSLEQLCATCRARVRMHAEHPITAASRRRQARRAPTVTCLYLDKLKCNETVPIYNSHV